MARRPRQRNPGEGSVLKWRDKWRGQVVTHLDERGQRHYRTKSFARKADATAWVNATLATLKQERERLAVVGQPRQTVADFLDAWLASRTASWAASTARSYEERVRLYLKPALGHLTLAELTPQHVDACLDQMRQQANLAPRTIQYARAVLRSALAQAIKRGTISRNSAALAEAPHVPRHEVQPLSLADATKVLAVIEGHPLAALYTVALAIGLRQGEALGLCWSDVDFERGEVRVVANLQRVGAHLVLVEPKTRRPRVIPLPRIALVALAERRAVQQADAERAGSVWRNADDLIFTTRTGGPLDRHNLYRQWIGFLRRAGVAHARFYDLRHTCASFLFAQGIPAKQVSEILGHTTIRLTLDTYTHLMPSQRRDTADAMDRLFPPQPPASEESDTRD